jgi:hypothetical protein
MPRTLESLRDLVVGIVADTFSEHRIDVPPLTSVYVDRYDTGGRFVPHTDREIYGPVVVGVSLGNGWGTLSFADGRETEVGAEVHPRSVYLMAEPLRFAPWTHRFELSEGRRWAVTYRSGAASHFGHRSTVPR